VALPVMLPGRNPEVDSPVRLQKVLSAGQQR
jgi:hypothetical protein